MLSHKHLLLQNCGLTLQDGLQQKNPQSAGSLSFLPAFWFLVQAGGAEGFSQHAAFCWLGMQQSAQWLLRDRREGC